MKNRTSWSDLGGIGCVFEKISSLTSSTSLAHFMMCWKERSLVISYTRKIPWRDGEGRKDRSQADQEIRSGWAKPLESSSSQLFQSHLCRWQRRTLELRGAPSVSVVQLHHFRDISLYLRSSVVLFGDGLVSLLASRIPEKKTVHY